MEFGVNGALGAVEHWGQWDMGLGEHGINGALWPVEFGARGPMEHWG